MSRFRNLLFIGVAGILVGCSDQEIETSVPSATQPIAVTSAAVSIEAPAASVLLPSGASVPATPPPGTAAASSIPRDPTAPIVEGSAQDPNVMPAGFVPKAPALEYTKNGQPNLEALSEALQVYCMWKKEVPTELEALVTSKFLPSLPPLPVGKKYGINSQSLTVVLVN